MDGAIHLAHHQLQEVVLRDVWIMAIMIIVPLEEVKKGLFFDKRHNAAAEGAKEENALKIFHLPAEK